MEIIDILADHIYTDNSGRFRLVTQLVQARNSAWRDVTYNAASLDATGRVTRSLRGTGTSGVWSFADWAVREATPDEAVRIRTFLASSLLP